MEAITQALNAVVEVFTIREGTVTIWEILTSNPLLQLLVGASVLALGFRFFRKAKRAAKG